VLVEKQLGLLLAIVRAHDATLFDVLGAILAGYLVLRLLHRWRVRRWLVRMRRAAASMGAAHPAFALPVIFDARPQTLRNPAAQPIARARPLDAASAATVDEALGAEAGVVYCVCPDHATAREIVGKMRAKGYTRIRTIRGDLDAWRRRGYPIRMDTPTSSDAPKPSALPHGHEPLTVRCVAPRRPR
jgi:rhodanese-related sulfurtransferase